MTAAKKVSIAKWGANGDSGVLMGANPALNASSPSTKGSHHFTPKDLAAFLDLPVPTSPKLSAAFDACDLDANEALSAPEFGQFSKSTSGLPWPSSALTEPAKYN